jgi:hypothetical protein
MFAVGQAKKVFHCGRIIGLVSGLIDRGQAGGPNEFVIRGHRRTRTHTNTALDALFETVKPGKIFRELDYHWKYSGNRKAING